MTSAHISRMSSIPKVARFPRYTQNLRLLSLLYVNFLLGFLLFRGGGGMFQVNIVTGVLLLTILLSQKTKKSTSIGIFFTYLFLLLVFYAEGYSPGKFITLLSIFLQIPTLVPDKLSK